MYANNLHLINTLTLEQKLLRMKELKDSIKILEAEFNMLKDETIEEVINHENGYDPVNNTAYSIMLTPRQ